MDNPFGETSEKEFLDELFEIAKKFNVQIISYTHITNDSVRKQFKKLYTMKVENTPSNKEIVSIEKLKKDKNDKDEKESVNFGLFGINNIEEYESQDSMFHVID